MEMSRFPASPALSFRTSSLAAACGRGPMTGSANDGRASGAAPRNQLVRLPSCLPVSATGLSGYRRRGRINDLRIGGWDVRPGRHRSCRGTVTVGPRPGRRAITMAASPQEVKSGAVPSRHDQPAGAACWTPARIIAMLAGSILALLSLGLLAAGATALWADHSQRQDGYLTSAIATYSASGHALASETVALHGWQGWLASFAGQVRIRVTATDPGKPVFAAMAPAPAARSYLSGVAYTSVTSLGNRA